MFFFSMSDFFVCVCRSVLKFMEGTPEDFSFLDKIARIDNVDVMGITCFFID